MLLLERLLPALAQRHDGAHVNLVERGQHRRVVLRFHETPRDRGSPLRHPLPFLDTTFDTGGLRRRRRSRLFGDGRNRLLDVLLHHTAGGARTLYRGDVDVVILRDVSSRGGRL